MEKIMKVKCLKRVHGCFAACSSLDVMLVRYFDLPFVPTKDVVILVPREDDKKDTEYVSFKEIYWETEKEMFKCYAEADKEIYDADLKKHSHRPIEEIVKEYTVKGWIEILK
jgi:hypothetical protein